MATTFLGANPPPAELVSVLTDSVPDVFVGAGVDVVNETSLP